MFSFIFMQYSDSHLDRKMPQNIKDTQTDKGTTTTSKSTGEHTSEQQINIMIVLECLYSNNT